MRDHLKEREDEELCMPSKESELHAHGGGHEQLSSDGVRRPDLLLSSSLPVVDWRQET